MLSESYMAKDLTAIIVADDDEFVRRYLVDVLEFAGYEILPASTGLSAFDLVLRRPDVRVLVTDVQMPEMDGLSLARRAREIRPDIEVIYVSGGERSEMAAHSLVPGSCFLQKPCRATVLLKAIAILLSSGVAGQSADALVA